MNGKTLRENIPLLSVLSIFLIGLGLIRQVIYYTYFGIQIQFYITVPELILVLSDTLILIIGLCFLIIFLFQIMKRRIDILHENKLKTIRSKNLAEIKKMTRKSNLILVALICLIVIAVLLLTLILHMNYKLVVLILLSEAISLTPIFHFEHAWKKNGTLSNNKNFVNSLYFGATALIVVVAVSAVECVGAEQGLYVGTKIFTKDSTYVSDKNHFYIGKTQNYYFIYNKDSSTLVIPEREVTKFDLKTH